MRKRTVARMFVACLVPALLVGCGAEDVVVPPDLLGVWVTDRVGYEEDAMEFRPASVIFSTGERDYRVHPIQGLDATGEPDFARTKIELVYSNDGKAVATVLYLSEDGGLVFQNQRGVRWHRADPTSLGDQ